MDHDFLKNVIIVYNEKVEKTFEVSRHIFSFFRRNGIEAKLVSIENIDQAASFAIVTGGDGSILKTARTLAYSDAFVFGVNLGRLGFLSQVSPANVDAALKKIFQNKFHVEKRMMLEIDGRKIFALNDVVIKGDKISRTSRFYIKINGNIICDYLADGIIVSTPTGSTAYGLSAGGPVLSPELEAFAIVPICPHTLGARPLVVPSSEKIHVSTCKTCQTLVATADGQDVFRLENEEGVIIEKSKFYANLMVLEGNDFYTILKEKLNWGKSPIDEVDFNLGCG